METAFSGAGRVQFALDITVPLLVKEQLKELASRMAARSAKMAHGANLLVHLKRDGPQVGCSASLLTGRGSYHARTTGWDARSAVATALDLVDAQLHKRLRRKASA